MLSLLKKAKSGTRRNQEYFIRYVSVGAVVVVVDVACFQTLVILQVPLPLYDKRRVYNCNACSLHA